MLLYFLLCTHLSDTHRHTSLYINTHPPPYSLWNGVCIVSVVAQGLCLCSVSLYSFVKCGFGRSLVGRVEGGRWQQRCISPLSFPLIVLSLLLSPMASQSTVLFFFFEYDMVYKLATNLAGDASGDHAGDT